MPKNDWELFCRENLHPNIKAVSRIHGLHQWGGSAKRTSVCIEPLAFNLDKNSDGLDTMSLTACLKLWLSSVMLSWTEKALLLNDDNQDLSFYKTWNELTSHIRPGSTIYIMHRCGPFPCCSLLLPPQCCAISGIWRENWYRHWPVAADGSDPKKNDTPFELHLSFRSSTFFLPPKRQVKCQDLPIFISV